MPVYEGGCLCGAIRYEAKGKPGFPHLCSCSQCRKWSGAPTVAWVEFPLESFAWTGPGGEPKRFQSSQKSRRGSCPICGSAISVEDEGYDKISITIASLDDPDAIVPGKQHSYKKGVPVWWSVAIERPTRTKKA
ncbi:MAG: GFA family protein [Pseudomonadota bacterium]